jgi:hypothetical protein
VVFLRNCAASRGAGTHREEIALVRARATGEELTVADLDSMVYTLATMKVELDLLLVSLQNL